MDPITETIDFSQVQRSDVPEIVRLLADDKLGRQRESDTPPLPECHFSAFDAIDRELNCSALWRLNSARGGIA